MEIQIYIICLGVGLLFTIASAFLGHFLGGGHDTHIGSRGHAEAGLGGHGMPSISAFSPTVLASFVTAFGGLGIIFHGIPATNSPWLNAPLAAAGAFGIAYVFLLLLRLLIKDTQGKHQCALLKP